MFAKFRACCGVRVAAGCSTPVHSFTRAATSWAVSVLFGASPKYSGYWNSFARGRFWQ